MKPTEACTCKGPEVLKCTRDCEAAPQHNPTLEQAAQIALAVLQTALPFMPGYRDPDLLKIKADAKTAIAALRAALERRPSDGVREALIVQCSVCGEGIAEGMPCRRKRGHVRPPDCKASPPREGDPDASGVKGRGDAPMDPQRQRDLADPSHAAFEEAMRQTWRMVDPIRPAGQPGSYNRGEHNGVCAALKTMRDNYERERRARGVTEVPRG